MTCGELYALFKIENPEIKVGKSIFFDLRPKNILLSSNITHSTCNCKVHGNIFLLMEALHKSSKKVIPIYSQEFPSSVICEDAKHDCYFNNCEACKDGALFMLKYPMQDIIDENENCDENDGQANGGHANITWYKWEETINLQGYSHLAKVIQEGDFSKLYSDFIAALPYFLKHSFIKRKQSQSYEACKEKLKDNPEYATMQFDFSQNMVCEWQDAPQSTHWYKTQLTIFTSVMWHLDEKKCQVIVSDDKGHNKESIIVFLDTLMRNMPKHVKSIDFWSDGPSSQFKNKFAVCIMEYLQEKTGISIKWNYFAASHGKGPVDGVGAIVKRYVTSKIMTRKVIVQDIESFLNAAEGCNIETIGKSTKEISAFNEENGIPEIFANAKKVKDISKMHAMALIEGECKTWLYEGMLLLSFLKL